MARVTITAEVSPLVYAAIKGPRRKFGMPDVKSYLTYVLKEYLERLERNEQERLDRAVRKT